MERDELITALADRVLRLASAIEKQTEERLALRREFSECRDMWETLQRESDHRSHVTTERLAAIEAALGIVRPSPESGPAINNRKRKATPSESFPLPGGVIVEVSKSSKQRWSNVWKIVKAVYLFVAGAVAIGISVWHWISHRH